MNFQEFRNTLHEQKVFSTRDVAKLWPGFNQVNLVNWQDKGYILKLRNTWYAFADTLKTEADLFFLANRLRRPSYISLETALRYYNWIPESVFSITSITTAKPMEWQTPVGHFIYRSVKPHFFFGYQPVENLQIVFNIADPEKTLLDFLYFNPKLVNEIDFQEHRLNREEICTRLNLDRTNAYLALIESPTLEKRFRSLQKFLGL